MHNYWDITALCWGKICLKFYKVIRENKLSESPVIEFSCYLLLKECFPTCSYCQQDDSYWKI